MKSKTIRLIFWVFVAVVSAVSIELKKQSIREKQQAKSISILSEKLEKGESVDTWTIERKIFRKTHTVSITPGERDLQGVAYVSQLVKSKLKPQTKVFDVHNENAIGTISEIAKLPDYQNAMYPVSIILDRNFRVLDGPYLSANIVTKEVPRAITVPLESVQVEDSTYYVFLVKEGVAFKQKVEVIDSNPLFYLIGEGLEVGDELIVRGVSKLKDQKNIRVRKNLSFVDLALHREVIQ